MSSFTGLNSKEDFYAALRENREREPGRARAAIAEEITDAAEAFGDRGVTVSALVEQMSAYHGSGESLKYPVTFARLLKLYDEAPEDFDEYEVHRVFWYFKWVSSSLLDTPDVPLASIKGWIGEMQRRYQKAGEGMQPVYAQKYSLATHTGDGEDLAYELWATRGRTQLSDCAACEARDRAHHWIDRGDDERGLRELEPTFAGRATCAEEPHTSQSVALLPLVRLGRLDEARTAHLSGYRAVRSKDSEVSAVGRHLEFCALTGNEARGLELLAQNRNLFSYNGSLFARLYFLTGVEVLLKRLEETGHGEVPCAGPVGREWTVGTLRAALGAEADALAARFDARNESTAVSKGRRDRLAAAVLVSEQLNLGVRSAALGLEGAEGGEVSGIGPAPLSPAMAPVPSTPVPDDFAELLTAARALDKQAHPDARRLWSVIAERAAGADAERVDDLVRGELAFERGYRAHRDDDWEGAKREFLEASQWYAKAGRQARVWSSEGRAVWSEATTEPGELVGDGDARPIAAAAWAWPQLEVLLNQVIELRAAGILGPELAEDAGSQQLVLRQCRLLVARHAALRASEHPDAAHWAEVCRAEGDALIADGTAFGVPLRVTLVHELRAEYCGANGDPEGAEREARQAIRIFTENDMPWRLHRPRMMLALSLATRGRLAEAASELQNAIAEAHPATEADEITPLHRVLGDVCSQSGEFATAIRAYSEAAVRLDRAGDVAEAVQTRWRMSKALMAQESTADAVAVLETLAEVELPEKPAKKAPRPRSEDVDVVAVAVAGAGVSVAAASQDSTTEATAEPVSQHPAEPSRNTQLLTQIRVDLGHGLLHLGEPRAAAVEFLRVADTVGSWPDQSRLTFAAAKAALALALADNWDAARAALRRALDANASAPCVPDLTDALRELATAAMRARGEEGFDEAMSYLAQADGIREGFPEAAVEQFVSVEYDIAQTAYVRGKVLLTVDRAEEALAAFDEAVARFDGSGHPDTSDRFEAVRMAAITELNHLDRTAAAHGRLDRAVAEAEQAGHRQAAEILGRLRTMKR